MTMDEPGPRRLDEAAKVAHAPRPRSFRVALSESLAAAQRRRLAAEDRAGYEAIPVEPDEFSGLIDAQGTGIRGSGEGR